MWSISFYECILNVIFVFYVTPGESTGYTNTFLYHKMNFAVTL